MFKFLKRKGEGVISGVIWLGIVAVISGIISYGVWNGALTNGNAANTNITGTMNTQMNNAKNLVFGP